MLYFTVVKIWPVSLNMNQTPGVVSTVVLDQ